MDLIGALRAEADAYNLLRQHSGFTIARGPRDFVLAHGRSFEAADHELPRGEPGMCFRNAFEVAARHPWLTYVEGYAWRAQKLMPIHHAWVHDQANPTRAYEVTWDTSGDEYVGVAFDLTFVRKQLLATGVWGLLDTGMSYPDFVLNDDASGVLT